MYVCRESEKKIERPINQKGQKRDVERKMAWKREKKRRI